ncbi:MAG: hypothetical protein HN778_05865 [Prolixibacteraceae bacterium]|jgi:hypothetical protein|nr:hypothetical protein [Prolixibacteraceae bacterium]MBT6006422.1 hypothetical protein [Prolixibacteraceae bacterium]MBT6763648.1 hypothetical protein [Prolixibacteraceae bacterium]MBT7394342.1 hypothetical protein [Prolixibacteraceae bacterium]
MTKTSCNIYLISLKKTFIISLFFGITFFGFSQDENFQIKFKANEDIEVWIGKTWDYSYNQLKNPINVEFNGKTLKMYYDTGEIFWEINAISYERKEKKSYDKLEKEVFIIKIEKKGFIQYLVIEKSYSYGDISTQIKIPFVTDTGETMNYHYYQEF